MHTGHSPVLRAQDPLVVVEAITEVRKSALPHRPKRAAQGDGAIAEQTCVDAGLHEAELEIHEQHRVSVVVEARIHQNAFQTQAGQELLQQTADGLLELRRYRMVEIGT